MRKRGPERAVPTVSEATTRARARPGAGARRLGVRAPAGARGARGPPGTRPRSRRCSRGLPNPRPPAGAAELARGARRARRARGVPRQLARGLGHVLVQVVRRARAQPAAPRADRRSAVARRRSSTTRSSGSTASPRERTRSRGPGTSTRWQRRFGELLERGGGSAGRAAQPRRGARRSRAPGPRSRPSSPPRPRPRPSSARARDLLELALRALRRGRRRARPRTRRFALGEVTLRGRIDRIDVDRRRPGASSATTRPARTVPPRTKFAKRGQAPDPALHARRRAHPRPRPRRRPLPPARRGRRAQAARAGRARGRRASRASGSSAPTGSTPRSFERALDEAEALAASAAREMRAGDIGRDPIGGKCPKYCTFQPICRLERALGVDEDNGG